MLSRACGECNRVVAYLVASGQCHINLFATDRRWRVYNHLVKLGSNIARRRLSRHRTVTMKVVRMDGTGTEGFGYECLLIRHTAQTPAGDGAPLCNIIGHFLGHRYGSISRSPTVLVGCLFISRLCRMKVPLCRFEFASRCFLTDRSVHAARILPGSTKGLARYCRDGRAGQYGVQYPPPRIRMINEAGILSTVAGGGKGGNSSPATSAQLYDPVAVVADQQGNVYIADNLYPDQYGFIWRVSGGIITLVDGINPVTDINSPTALALDSKGSVYIASEMSHCILQIAGGILSVFAGQCGSSGFSGDGGAAAGASLNDPVGVAVDPSGTVYISDSGSCKIRSVVAGIIATVVDFIPTDPNCSGPPLDIAADSTSLYFYRPDGMYKWTSALLP
jgi:hypothetical protein